MASAVLFMTTFMILSHVSQCQEGSCGGPAEEGTEHVISCSTFTGESDFGVSFIYRSSSADEWHYLADCYDKDAPCYLSSTYSGYFEAYFASGEPDYTNSYDYSPVYDTANLTIYNVSRSEPFDMQVEWRCHWNVPWDMYLCDPLQIYSKAENVECESATYDSSTDTVHITCTTDHIYPQAKCQLYLRNSSGADFQPVNPPTSYAHTPLNEEPVYYSSQCSFTLQGQDLEETPSYDYYVTIYPDLYGGEAFGKDTAINPCSAGAPTTTTTPVPETTTTTTQSPTTTTDGENSATTTTPETTTNESPRHTLPISLLFFVAVTISILSQALM